MPPLGGRFGGDGTRRRGVSSDGLVGGARAIPGAGGSIDDGPAARGLTARLLDWRPWAFRAGRVTLHRAAGAGGPGEAIGYQRVTLAIRGLALGVVALIMALSTTVQ